MLALVDANVIYAGIVGRADGESAILLATIRLGGIEAFTTENAMEEARRHLLAYFNRNRLKLHSTEADRELKALRECPTFTVVPWVTAPASLLPDNRKDAYLLEAMRAHRPHLLLTLDRGLLEMDSIDGTVIDSPARLLATLELFEGDDGTS